MKHIFSFGLDTWALHNRTIKKIEACEENDEKTGIS